MTATEQRAAALTAGNLVRCQGASIKRALAGGSISLHDALHHPAAGSLRVSALLCSLRGVGESTATRVITAHRISEGRRVRELTDRQRALLAADGRLVTRYHRAGQEAAA